jgi:choline dehydrogenase
VIGGSGTVNGSIFLRPEPQDFELWGSDLWNWDAVLPYFNKYETDVDFGSAPYHRATGPMPIRRQSVDGLLPFGGAFRESILAAGHVEEPDLNSPDAIGVGPLPRNLDENLIRMTPSLTHLLPARGRANLQVLGDTPTTRITFSGHRATGVEAVNGGQLVRVSAGEVILSAGALASPQLLMLSGVGPSGDIAPLGIPVVHDMPGVGANHSDHAGCEISLQPKPQFAHPSDGPSVQLTLLATADGSATRRDIQIGGHSRADRVGPDGLALFRFTCSLSLPRSRGRVSLASANPGDKPRLEYHFMEDASDLARMRFALRTCAGFAAHDAVREVTTGSVSIPEDVLADDDALNARILETVGTASHGMGTCRMGPSAEDLSVVDELLRVHGLERLRVIDASIPPSVTRGNAHSTVLMIGERAAALIKGEAR